MKQFLYALFRKIISFSKAQDGSVFIMVAMGIIPLITVIAIGVDISRAYMVKSRLSSALDAASLAGGRAFYLSYRDDDIHMLFNANFPSGYLNAQLSDLDITVDQNEETIHLARSATIDTTFLKLININQLTVDAEAQIHRRKTALDLVLAMDMSGSMNYSASGGGTRIEAARDAAQTLVNILFGNKASKEFLTIGVVPWNSKVNVQIEGTHFDPALTISDPVVNFTNPITGNAQNLIYRINNSPVPFLSPPPSNWRGCAYSRFIDDNTETTNADLNDTPFMSPAIDWVAWEPIGPEGEPVSGGTCSASVNGYECTPCLQHGITPLSNQRTVIDNAINALQNPRGSTNITGGLGWAWRTLTPPAPFSEALEDPEVERTRAIVLLTDGAQVGGNGDAYKGQLGIGSNARPEMDARLRQLANNIKSDGIVIYSIQFAYENSNLQALMQDVASGPESPYYHFAPDRESLNTIFLEVANHVSELRLSK